MGEGGSEHPLALVGDQRVDRLLAGHQVGVIGSVAAPQYRTEAGLRMLGPAHFGFGLPYRPIEAVIGQVAV